MSSVFLCLFEVFLLQVLCKSNSFFFFPSKFLVFPFAHSSSFEIE